MPLISIGCILVISPDSLALIKAGVSLDSVPKVSMLKDYISLPDHFSTFAFGFLSVFADCASTVVGSSVLVAGLKVHPILLPAFFVLCLSRRAKFSCTTKRSRDCSFCF